MRCKTFLLAIIITISSISYSQESTRLSFIRSNYSSISVLPDSDKQKMEGNPGEAKWLDYSYMNTLLYRPTVEVLSKEKRDSISIGTGFYFAFNNKGEIIYWRLIINFKDTAKITKNEIIALYHKFKNIKIDMSKIKIDSGDSTKPADFAVLQGFLTSQESRNRILKRHNENLNKQNKLN